MTTQRVCKAWTLYGIMPGWDTHLPLTGGTYNDVRNAMKWRKREGYSALAIVRDIPWGQVYEDGSEDSRHDRVAASLAFGLSGEGMPQGHYWDKWS